MKFAIGAPLLAALVLVLIGPAPWAVTGDRGFVDVTSPPVTRVAGVSGRLSAETGGAQQAVVDRGRDFYFTRAVFSGGRGFRGRGAWSTDYPKADRQFLFVIRRLLTLLDAYEWENPVRLDDPQLRRFPFLYALEVGFMDLTEPEVEGLRSYLEAGGFLVIDDFWGARQWANFEYQMSRVLPDRRIIELPLDHQIFHQFYDIDEILQVPNIGNGVRGGSYAECAGCPPRVFAILDDQDGVVDEADRIMVVINFNTDLGDAWEWSENPMYPFRESSYAYELAINYIIYAMTH
ncbi:MAG: DUF4159 domain-containing protein [Gemmatimonadota bacterium]